MFRITSPQGLYPSYNAQNRYNQASPAVSRLNFRGHLSADEISYSSEFVIAGQHPHLFDNEKLKSLQQQLSDQKIEFHYEEDKKDENSSKAAGATHQIEAVFGTLQILTPPGQAEAIKKQVFGILDQWPEDTILVEPNIQFSLFSTTGLKDKPKKNHTFLLQFVEQLSKS